MFRVGRETWDSAAPRSAGDVSTYTSDPSREAATTEISCSLLEAVVDDQLDLHCDHGKRPSQTEDP